MLRTPHPRITDHGYSAFPLETRNTGNSSRGESLDPHTDTGGQQNYSASLAWSKNRLMLHRRRAALSLLIAW
jgi:hypothetical protein